jgi:hypothetical protein
VIAFNQVLINQLLLIFGTNTRLDTTGMFITLSLWIQLWYES